MAVREDVVVAAECAVREEKCTRPFIGPLTPREMRTRMAQEEEGFEEEEEEEEGSIWTG